jgi:8-oxo-dGTP diphosphatase
MAVVRVAAAVILGSGGEVLLAQRPAGKAYAGYWEFPGGKLEPGETVHDALVRELSEELGLEVVDAAPWLVQRYTYPHADVELNFFRVFAFTGEPFGHDGQAFRWQTPGRFDVAPLLPANTAILRALELPPVCGVVPPATLADPSSPTILRRALDQGLGLIRVDAAAGAAIGERAAIERLAGLAAAAGARVLLGGNESDARALGCAGVHWTAAELRAATARPADLLVGATCAHAADIAQAGALGLDFVELERVATSAVDGWAAFAQAIAATAVPVFARGGLARSDLAFAQRQGAHGVALALDAK